MFAACPSESAQGREDRCGQFSFPRLCGPEFCADTFAADRIIRRIEPTITQEAPLPAVRVQVTSIDGKPVNGPSWITDDSGKRTPIEPLSDISEIAARWGNP